ncbi:hypothetical protein LZ686_16635 [Paracoccus sp. NFXS7]
MTTSQEALTRLIDGLTDRAGNLASGSVYPDQLAPIIRDGDDGPELVKARWGMPSPPSVLKTARDPGVTNVRNLGSPHWRRWLGQGHRCLVPLTSFSEPRGKGRGVQWFAPTDTHTRLSPAAGLGQLQSSPDIALAAAINRLLLLHLHSLHPARMSLMDSARSSRRTTVAAVLRDLSVIRCWCATKHTLLSADVGYPT